MTDRGEAMRRPPRAPMPRRTRMRWAVVAAVATCWAVALAMTGSVVSGTVLLLFAPLMRSTTVKTLTYSQFYGDVLSDQVTTASIDPDGAVTGTLKGGQEYKTQIPTALSDTGLSAVLRDHDVQITGKPQSSGGIASIVLSFLPFLFLIGLFVFLGRRTGRQMAAGLGSITGAMLGGILFGLIETFSTVFLSSAYKDGIGMILLIAILLVFPSGLVGLWQKRR